MKINIPIRNTVKNIAHAALHDMSNVGDFIKHKITDAPMPTKDQTIYAQKMHQQQQDQIFKNLK